jgi:hypothetical protein
MRSMIVGVGKAQVYLEDREIGKFSNWLECDKRLGRFIGFDREKEERWRCSCEDGAEWMSVQSAPHSLQCVSCLISGALLLVAPSST